MVLLYRPIPSGITQKEKKKTSLTTVDGWWAQTGILNHGTYYFRDNISLIL